METPAWNSALCEGCVYKPIQELMHDCRLREYCERLMFYNPLYYGKKAEEVLWRKVFYDIIQLIKKNRRVSVLYLTEMLTV